MNKLNALMILFVSIAVGDAVLSIQVASPSHGEVGQAIIAKARISSVDIKNKRVSWRQVSDVIKTLDSEFLKAFKKYGTPSTQQEVNNTPGAQSPAGVEELSNFLVRFSELFPPMPDDVMFPMTWLVKLGAPESTFKGLVVYGKKGESLGHITGKYMEWETVTGRGELLTRHEPSHYIVLFKTDKGKGWLTGYTEDSCYLKWGDVKDRTLYERSDQKRIEDARMANDAFARPSRPF